MSSGLTSPALGAFTAEAIPSAERGRAGSIYRMAGDVASLCAPVALGLLADYQGCSTAIVTSAALAGGCSTFFALRAREVGGVGGVHGGAAAPRQRRREEPRRPGDDAGDDAGDAPTPRAR